MLKRDAIEAFGGVTRLADAVEFSHPSISNWPEVLSRKHSDQVRGAMVRKHIRIPQHMRSDDDDEARLVQVTEATGA